MDGQRAPPTEKVPDCRSSVEEGALGSYSENAEGEAITCCESVGIGLLVKTFSVRGRT